MKILHILNELNYSGAELMVACAAKIWIKSGIELHVLSTGEKKGVMLTHQNLISNTNSILKTLPINKKDTVNVEFDVLGKYINNSLK